MKRRASILCLVLLMSVGLFGDFAAGQNQRPPRLVIDNHCSATAYVEVWAFNGSFWQWNRFAAVNPNSWLPVFNVRQGQRFRAQLPDNRDRTYDVVFAYDANYGGYQSVWVIQ